MIDKISKYWHSLQTRIFISVLVMILPATILMFSSYNAIHGSINSLSEIVDAPLEILLKTQKMQSTILKTELPFHLYLNRGESADRETFIRLSVDIDIMFENINKHQNFSKQNKEIIILAQNEWYSAKTLGESLLTTTNIPKQNILVAKIDQFGRHLGRCVSLLDEIKINAQEKIENLRFTAQEKEWEAISKLSLIFGLGVLLAVLAALSLGQSVIKPIRQLEQTVNRFGQGETNARIELQTNNELDDLATAFSNMAERFEHLKGELDYLSIHDNLTGLYDRSKLHDEVTS